MLRFIPYDKALHFIVGVLLACVLVYFLSPLHVLLVSLAVGVSKEIIWDKILNKGSPEVLDVAYQIAGTLIILIINLTS